MDPTHPRATLPPPRLYCVPATEAPIVAVFRRGPSAWSHVGRWDLESGCFESGAWLKGRLFPRRSDLSPDGRLLSVFIHKPGAAWEHGDAWVQLSRLPWLTALHAFGTCGTWTRGYHFTDDRSECSADDADLPIPWGLRPTPAVQFATERRRGWSEAPESPPRIEGDPWDERRNARIVKVAPDGVTRLFAESVGWAGGERERQAIDGLRVRYWIEAEEAIDALDDLQWADLDPAGRLLAATRDGRLQVRETDGVRTRVLDEHDLRDLRPDPTPAPDWAGEWGASPRTR